ncbi:MAG: bifunctional 2-C-methyl-D-erythritol 4-phosphate cytidylyltransferase/2-C-methyl-D-erythritol 2,4-cyclodiphosphate synthase [Rhodospirillaceae bacterium]|nr:bifunctional 2-C-methyl-D-erythritol 4-phosphate cytidylyltransferase/2-C-methyl-D-erythritol 2,4-cyclodiphosphate synthase [Rhodospirillaceae bacterium]
MAQDIGTVALIVSAGRGHRIGGETPKQYLPLDGHAILYQSIVAFLSHEQVDVVRVVIHPDDEKLYDRAIEDLDILSPVFGGAERQDSVRLGLQSLQELDPERVLIHDAARPWVSGDVIAAVLDAVHPGQGALPGLAMTDTVKSVTAEGFVKDTLERGEIWCAQTPQGFMFGDILHAHLLTAGHSFSDDAEVAESNGMKIKIVRGDPENIKITHPRDMARLNTQDGYSMSATRVGCGFDVHRFGIGELVTLCGIDIPFNRSLVGHSDADVGYHALTDALLGAAGKDDIGTYFPPSDARWKDISSDIFLRHAVELLESIGAKIENVDVTIICELPRIGPHRNAMREQVAKCLSIDPGRVNIKGTTTEKLGFLGREEGIAAQAIATIKIG